jgi:hypothetical protein
VTARAHRAEACPHCGAHLDGSNEPQRHVPRFEPPSRFDLEAMATLARAEKAYDETVKVRVTQEDIRKLVAKRRKKVK